MTAPTPFPADRTRRPVAVYRAVSSRDASSLDRDGQPVLESRRLATRNGRPEAEVLFSDGQWQLCDPERDLVPGFTFDAFPDDVFLAVEYGEAWNGWDTPVVCRDVLVDLLEALELEHRWDCDVAVIAVEDYEDRLEPRQDGLYDLAQAGWTVQQVELA
ncbi:hypothetical protein [Micrococcus luteus]|uniref:hypothetical protein n=1 Tax=Micrococcus luteus TaxID=1270 RepID=UPI0010094A90|nr:hypothetical protein [Micrococcus luteus]QAV29295.1 hypothetical protein MT1254_08225 [Micrococcus luteus]